MSTPRTIIRFSALILMVATLGWWMAAGAHRGWSMNRVPQTMTDEFTGLDYVEYQDRFVPGIDILGGGIALAALALTVSFFIRPKTKTN
tara:strand:+ start:529 stop:795 length:267 start_codon:yes stop_codon:yes gene_type:complete